MNRLYKNTLVFIASMLFMLLSIWVGGYYLGNLPPGHWAQIPTSITIGINCIISFGIMTIFVDY